MKKGLLMLVLHAHLPFVRHPEHEFFLEERWLFEAITETYIPLIEMFEGLLNDGVPFKMTMSLTPTLTTMLQDGLLQERYILHINRLIELSEKEVERTKHEPAFHHLANMYREIFYRSRDIFERRYGRDLIRAFRRFQDTGNLEIITCGATHGFFPLMQTVPSSVRAQVSTAANHYEKTFGRRPRGIWLPECGYQPGYDQYLKENGIDYFFVDTHGVLNADPRPKYGVFSPIRTPHGTYAFGRDMESSKQVWSAVEGYPGDYVYREFYRDIGFDADYNYIKPYIHPDGFRLNTGIKYFRITGSDHKEPYHPDWAREKAAEHAGNFMFNREKQAQFLLERMERQPVIVAPYDAELFGHWWFEGPQFLNFLIRKIAYDSQYIEMTHAPDYLGRFQGNIQPSEPSFSSWGYKGYAEFWLEGSNDWIYRHLHNASEKMSELARRFEYPNELERRALNQAARELLLAESSDWAFIMTTGTMVPYAVSRTRDHLISFLRIYDQLMNGDLDYAWLLERENKYNIFPDVNYRVYA